MRYFSTASTEPVMCDVAAVLNGAAVNPTADVVSFAFLSTESAVPVSGDFTVGTWDTDAGPTPDRYAAVCVIGPGAKVLAAGIYWVWVKIAHSPYTIIRQVGTIVVA